MEYKYKYVYIMSVPAIQGRINNTMQQINGRITEKNNLIQTFKREIITRLEAIIIRIRNLRQRVPRSGPQPGPGPAPQPPQGPGDRSDEIQRLRDEITRLQTENGQMRNENAQLNQFINDCEQSILGILGSVGQIDANFDEVNNRVTGIERELHLIDGEEPGSQGQQPPPPQGPPAPPPPPGPGGPQNPSQSSEEERLRALRQSNVASEYQAMLENQRQAQERSQTEMQQQRQSQIQQEVQGASESQNQEFKTTGNSKYVKVSNEDFKIINKRKEEADNRDKKLNRPPTNPYIINGKQYRDTRINQDGTHEFYVEKWLSPSFGKKGGSTKKKRHNKKHNRKTKRRKH